MPRVFDLASIPPMLVVETDDAVYAVALVEAFNRIDELAHVTGRPARFWAELARLYQCPLYHERGVLFFSGAVAEVYAEFRDCHPDLFAAARAPALARVLSQIRQIEVRPRVE
jgi:hypothetical protein